MPPPGPPQLGPRAAARISTAVDEVFDRLKHRMLGPHAAGKKLYIGYNRDFSLPGIFEAAAREEGALPNLTTLHQLLKVAGGYVDAQRERTKAKVLHDVQAFLTEAHTAGVTTDLKTVLEGKLSDVWTETAASVRRIIDTEAQYSKNVGFMEGIMKINAAAGIDDPVVYWVVVRDEDLCDECRRLHLLDDGKTPRVWKLSEMGHGYHTKGEENPKAGGLHPHCLTASMRLHTGQGLRTVGELFREQLPVQAVVDARVKNRREGNNQFGAEIPGRVWFHRHASGARLLPATQVYETGIQECLKITLDSGQELEVSVGHEMWVDDNKSGRKIRADALKVGDKIPLISGEGGFGTDHFPELAELMGNLMGDGSLTETSHGWTAEWNFFGNDIPYGQELKRKSLQFCREDALETLKVNPPDDKYRVESAGFTSVRLGRVFVDEFGLSKKPRRVPARLWTADRETVTSFLRGVYAADGHSEAIPAVVLAQNDREFLLEIQTLLSMLGLNARLFTHGEEEVHKLLTYADGRVFDVARQPCWRLSLGGIDQCLKFSRDIGMGVPTKQQALEQRLAAAAGKKRHGSWRTALVAKIESIGPQQTYCLTEPMTNTITVNGIVTGNCRCTMVTLMPGYGFNSAGFVTFITHGHDEWKHQRG